MKQIPRVSELNRPVNPAENSRPKIILAVGGGKGGIGKTVITAAFGIALASQGRKTILIDADLGGANLHTCMGMLSPPLTLRDFFERLKPRLQDVVLETAFDNLQMVSGAPGVLGMDNQRHWEKQKFLSHLWRLDADFVILDLGASASFNEIDLFLAADQGVVVANPEPTSIYGAYGFIKACLFRRLKRRFRDWPEVIAILDRNRGRNYYQETRTMASILQELATADESYAQAVQETIAAFRPKLILNMVDEETEAKEAVALEIACQELLNVQVEYCGHIFYDEAVRHAVKTMRPELFLQAEGIAADSIRRIVQTALLKTAGITESRRQWTSQRHAQSTALAQTEDGELICSVRCSCWGNCNFQRGGYPCKIKYVGFVRMKRGGKTSGE